jgi:predicted transcriptional regulator
MIEELQRRVMNELCRPQAGGFTTHEIATIFGLTDSQAVECLESLRDLGLARRVALDCDPVIWFAAYGKDAP